MFETLNQMLQGTDPLVSVFIELQIFEVSSQNWRPSTAKQKECYIYNFGLLGYVT